MCSVREDDKDDKRLWVKGCLRSLSPFFHQSIFPEFYSHLRCHIDQAYLHRLSANYFCFYIYIYLFEPQTPKSPSHQSKSCLFSLFNSYNSLTEVEGSEFKSLRQLEMLMLHGNDISTVHPGAFYSLRSMQVGFVCMCETQ